MRASSRSSGITICGACVSARADAETSRLPSRTPPASWKAQPPARSRGAGLDRAGSPHLIVVVVPRNDLDFAVGVAAVRAGVVGRLEGGEAREDGAGHAQRVEEALCTSSRQVDFDADPTARPAAM